MSTARVDSIDSLKVFRVALIKFGEEASAALSSAESEMQRMLGWLERDQVSYWQFQIRKRQEALERAQEALRMKKLFPDASGRFPTPVEEEKAVRRCKAAVEEAHEKLANCKKYSRVLQKELMNYKGGVMRFSTWVAAEIPNATARLDKMVSSLEAYVSLRASVSQSDVREASLAAFTGGEAVGGSMARAPAEEEDAKPQAAEGGPPAGLDAQSSTGDNTMNRPQP